MGAKPRLRADCYASPQPSTLSPQNYTGRKLIMENGTWNISSHTLSTENCIRLRPSVTSPVHAIPGICAAHATSYRRGRVNLGATSFKPGNTRLNPEQTSCKLLYFLSKFPLRGTQSPPMAGRPNLVATRCVDQRLFFLPSIQCNIA